MLVWIENISPSEFEVCLRESRVFDGSHEKLRVVSDCLYNRYLFLCCFFIFFRRCTKFVHTNRYKLVCVSLLIHMQFLLRCFLYFKLFIVIIVIISIISCIFSSINIMIIIFSVCRSFNCVDVLVLVLKSI